MTALSVAATTNTTNRPDRVRPWLEGNYDDHQWVIKDSNGGSDRRIIDFRFRMPDGRLLIEHTRLYATVKEFTFWIREGLFQDVKDAEQHRSYFNAVTQLAYAVADKGRASFSELVSLDVQELAAAAQFGADQLYRGSEKLGLFLDKFDSWAEVPPELLYRREFNRHAVVEACNLPRWINRKLSYEFARTAARLSNELIPERPKQFEKKITSSNVRRYTATLEGLYILKFVMKAEGLSFNPFSGENSAVGEFTGEDTAKTEIAPIDLMLDLLNKSVRYLMDNRDAASRDYRAVCIGRASGSVSRRDAIEARKKLQLVMIAAYIIIAAFTARRTTEIRLITRECLAGNDDYGYWLKVFIVKNHQTQTWIPVPNVVARAVETLLMFDVRYELGDNSTLFTYYDCIQNEVVECHVHLMLNEYAEKVGAAEYVEDQETKSWLWKTRHFRRFFAVLYLYRFQGNIEALSHHLRHFNLEMTRSYLTLDPELKAIWLREEWGFKKKLAVSIATGSSEYSGPVGERLKKLARKLIEKFYGQITIVEEQVAEVILRAIDRRSYVFKPQYWVTCTCPNTHSASDRANCRKLEAADVPTLGPSFEYASPHVCSGCSHGLTDSRNREAVDKEVQRLNKIQGNGATTLFHYQQVANLAKLTAFQAKLPTQ